MEDGAPWFPEVGPAVAAALAGSDRSAGGGPVFGPTRMKRPVPLHTLGLADLTAGLLDRSDPTALRVLVDQGPVLVDLERRADGAVRPTRVIEGGAVERLLYALAAAAHSGADMTEPHLFDVPALHASALLARGREPVVIAVGDPDAAREGAPDPDWEARMLRLAAARARVVHD